MVKIKLATFYIILTLIIASGMFYSLKYTSQKLLEAKINNPNATKEYDKYIEIVNNIKQWAYVAVLVFGILGVLGALLPYEWGKSLMDLTFLFLLVAILLLEAMIAFPHFKLEKAVQPLVPTVECTESPDVGTPQGAINFITCLFTGYQYDGNQKDWLGITTFLVFYVILPFAFITALLWGLFNGLKLTTLFGGNDNIARTVNKIMTVVVALYATREVMGGVLLQFFGVSVWGIAAIFIAGVITAFVRNIVVKFIGIELVMTNLIKAEKKRERELKATVKMLAEKIKIAEETMKTSVQEAVEKVKEINEEAYFAGLINEKTFNINKRHIGNAKLLLTPDENGNIPEEKIGLARQRLRIVIESLKKLIRKPGLRLF